MIAVDTKIASQKCILTWFKKCRIEEKFLNATKGYLWKHIADIIMNTIEQGLPTRFKNNEWILSLTTSIQCTISFQYCTGYLIMVTRERKGALRQESRKLIFVLVTGYITKFIDHKVSITTKKLSLHRSMCTSFKEV